MFSPIDNTNAHCENSVAATRGNQAGVVSCLPFSASRIARSLAGLGGTRVTRNCMKLLRCFHPHLAGRVSLLGFVADFRDDLALQYVRKSQTWVPMGGRTSSRSIANLD